MSPTLAAAIDAAIDLAWRPTYNIPGSVAYHDRHESHRRLCERLSDTRLPSGASSELRFLVAAMRRAAGCSYANRQGHAYYERKQAIYELRGCLAVWQKSAAA